MLQVYLPDTIRGNCSYQSINQLILICIALNDIQRRLRALAQINRENSERQNKLGPQSKQGATVTRKTSPEGRNLEQIHSPEGRRLPMTIWGENRQGEREG